MKKMLGPQPVSSNVFPAIKSKHSLVVKYVTEPIWEKLNRAKTQTSGFTLAKAIDVAVKLKNTDVGIVAGDWDSYKVILAKLLFIYYLVNI